MLEEVGHLDMLGPDTTQQDAYALLSHYFGELRVKTAAELFRVYDCPYSEMIVSLLCSLHSRLCAAAIHPFKASQLVTPCL